MALYKLRARGVFRPRFALLAVAGVAVSIPLGAFILLFPIFGSYLVLYVAFARGVPVIPAARFGDLSYGLYIYGWPIEQLVTRSWAGRRHGGRCSRSLPVTAGSRSCPGISSRNARCASSRGRGASRKTRAGRGSILA